MSGREISKFFSGFAANQLLTHGTMAVSGIQFTIFGIRYTPRLNMIAAVVWAVILILLLYYSWLRR